MTDKGWFSDMVRNYLGFFLGLWLALSPAWAAEVLVGDLALSYQSPWERGLATEEDSENSAILRWQDDWASMTVFLPHHQVELKSDEGRFYRQLEQQWRALYGADARIYPMEMGGTKWRVCRRPSLNGDATVFQLVTVREGRAHHLLVIAPGRLQTLPDAAERLIASASWGGVRSVVFTRNSDEALSLQHALPLPAPVKLAPEAPAPAAFADLSQPQGEVAAVPSPEPMPPAVVAAPPTQPSGAPELNLATTAPETVAVAAVTIQSKLDKPWRLDRVVHAVPKGAGLAALAEMEAGRLGGQAVLSGYGLTRQEHGIKGFVEGYVWQEGSGKRPVRKDFARRWQLQWQAPTEILAGEQAWLLSPRENSLVGEAGQAGGLNVRLELTALCGPRDALVATFNSLEKGMAVGERLSALSRACRLPEGPPPAAVQRLQPGDVGEQSLRFQLRPAWADHNAGGKGMVKQLVIVASYPPAMPESGLGDWLLAGARSYYIYTHKE